MEKTPQDHRAEALRKFRLAEHYYQNGMYEKAIPLYEKVIKVLRLLMPAYHHLASCYEGLGNIKEAIRVYKQALMIDPNDKISLGNLNRLQLKHIQR
jgi:tetratricopeptide (TPR) repeat protein